MSKVYKIRQMKDKYVEHLICDLCGKQSEGEDWTTGSFEVNQTDISIFTRVEYRNGVQYPEGGHGDDYEVDLCPDCFMNKLIPWLKKQGAEIHEKEWDW